MTGLYTVLLLLVSNIFMTIAWYGHLKLQEMKLIDNWPLFAVVLFSWGIALFEYSFQVPANRIGFVDNGPGSRLPDRIHRLYHIGIQRPDLPLEPHRRLRLPDSGRLLRVHEINRAPHSRERHYTFSLYCINLIYNQL